MLLDWPSARCSLESLSAHAASLKAGAMPVGSVEFVREAMRVAAIGEPAPMSYPEALNGLLLRDVRLAPARDALGFEGFVKPAKTKLFTGFVNKPARIGAELGEHIVEQMEALSKLDGEEPVWLGEPVDFVGEWRAYVSLGRILGVERYDPDGIDGVEPPDVAWIKKAVAMWMDSGSAPRAFSLDVGRLSSGELALVEANDAWALGLYGRSVSDKEYAGMLAARWSEIWGASLMPKPKVSASR
jgi:hypothetical protein